MESSRTDIVHIDGPIERYLDGAEVIALVVRASYDAPGANFFSPGTFSQQLGVITYPTGHVIPCHVHNPVAREVIRTQETLIIRSGSLRVHLYDDGGGFLATFDLGPGDVILLAGGGHGFEVIEDCSMVEVKQGPYAGENDKRHFTPGPAPAGCDELGGVR